MPTKQRINVRTSPEFDFRLVGKAGQFGGVIKEVSWFPAGVDENDPSAIKIGVSIKIDSVDAAKNRLKPADAVSISMSARQITRGGVAGEMITELKLLTPENQERPEAFEDKLVYQYQGIMLAGEQ